MKSVTTSSKTDGPAVLAGQTITHPERVIDPASGATKLDLARYYATVAPLILPHLAKRPEGLPTAEELRAAHMKYVEGYRKGENNGSMCATDFALEYLTPYIHMPMKANL